MTQVELVDACESAVQAFQAFRDQYSEEQWDELMDKAHVENLLDALCELEYQVEERPLK